MQQTSATQIFYLITVKGTVDSYIEKIAQPFKTVQFQAWKITPSCISLKKKQKNVLGHLK